MTVSWSFGDGSSATGTAVTHTYPHTGSFPVTVTATDALGNSTSQSGSITVAASTSAPGRSAGGSGTGGTTGGLGTSGGTLTVTDLRLLPERFRRGTHAATVAAAKTRKKANAIPKATTISFTLSRTATVTLTFQRAQPGVSSAGRCLAPSPKRRHGRRCTRYTTVHGSVSIAAPAGADRIGFDGLLAGATKLAPGSYRLALSASDGSVTVAAAQHPVFSLLG